MTASELGWSAPENVDCFAQQAYDKFLFVPISEHAFVTIDGNYSRRGMAPLSVSWDSSIFDPPVRGFLHAPANPNGDALVLTHGAGANCASPLLVALADTFCDTGLTVLRCDLPFRQLRPQGPPLRTAESDQQGLRNAVEAMGKQVSGRIFLGGHSYGGRMATMLVAADPDLVAGLLLLSYPLHPPKKPQQMRTAHFPNLRTPALFVHGSRDGFGSHDEMAAVLKLIPARTELLPVASAGHELLTKSNREELPRAIIEAFRSFAS